MILGRDEELADLSRFLDAISNGPSVSVLEGTAGIGKTTLWLAGLNAAKERGYRAVDPRR